MSLPTSHAAELTVGHTRAAVGALRPALLGAYDAAVPAARAHILAQVWGALGREPVPGVAGRAHHAGLLHVTLGDGRSVAGDASTARPFAAAPPGFEIRLDGVAYTDPVRLLQALRLPGAADRLTTEVRDSVANLALARAARAAAGRPGPVVGALRAAAGDPDGPGRLEQLVTDGHPLHPCCRTRGAMGLADVLAYAPEHSPVLRLRRYRVPPDRWYGTAAPVLLAHPWQADRLMHRYPWLVADGETSPVRPLMSLRTVAPLDGGDHIKTAVDVQMTSAVRTVSPAAVHNGPVLSALLRRLTADLPTLGVLTETAAGAVVVDSIPQRHLAYVRRQAPPVAAGTTVVALGALAAVSPGGGRSLLAEAVDGYGGDPYAWFTDLCAVLLPPLLTLLHRGVALEAHGQNTLLVLSAWRPVRVLYRDLGGVRVSPDRLRDTGTAPPGLHGDLVTHDPGVLRTKLAASALTTVLGEQVALLGRGHDADPDRLWRIAATTIRRAGPARDVDALLGEPLPVKAMTTMRLAADPLEDVWCHVANPMAVHA